MTSRLHERYTSEVVPALQKQFEYGNPNQVPRLSKIVVNIGLVLLARLVLGGNALDLSATFFFVLLLSLLVTMHDRFAPVAAVRAEHDRTDAAPAPAPAPEARA